MKAVHLAPGHPPFDTRVFHKECMSLARAGWEVVLVVQHDHEETVGGVRVVPLPRATGRAMRFLRSPILLLRRAWRERGDIYHLHDIEALPVGVVLALLRRDRVVWDSHEDFPRLALDRQWIPPPARRPVSWLVRVVERGAVRLFAAVISAEEAGAARFPPAKTVVVHNYALEAEYTDAEPTQRRAGGRVLYVGDITRQRGAIEMVDAVGLVRESLAPTLVLVGRINPPALRAEMATRPGWARTEERGWLDRRGVAGALAEASVGLVLWHPTRKHAEGAVPVKLFEYLAAGMPVVASDFPAIRAIVGEADAGILVDPLNIEQVATAITALLGDPAAAAAMGQRGRELVLSRYTWSSQEQRLLRLYRDLVAA